MLGFTAHGGAHTTFELGAGIGEIDHLAGVFGDAGDQHSVRMVAGNMGKRGAGVGDGFGAGVAADSGEVGNAVEGADSDGVKCVDVGACLAVESGASLDSFVSGHRDR